jgi:hypothetical protein
VGNNALCWLLYPAITGRISRLTGLERHGGREYVGGRFLPSSKDATLAGNHSECLEPMIPTADSVFLKEVLDSLDLSVVVYDPDLRFVLANTAYYATFPKVPSDGSRRGWSFESMLRATIAADPARTALESPEEIDAWRLPRSKRPAGRNRPFWAR